MINFASYTANPLQGANVGMQTLMRALGIRQQRQQAAVAEERNKKLFDMQAAELDRTRQDRDVASSVFSEGFTGSEAAQEIAKRGGDPYQAQRLLLSDKPEGPPQLTGTAKNFEIVHGRKPTPTEFDDLLTKKRPLTEVTTEVVNPQQETKFREGIGKYYSEEFGGIQKEGKEAWNNQTRLQRAETLVTRLNTGKLKPTTNAIKSVIKGLGFEPEKYGITDDVGMAEALKSVSIDLTMDTVQRTKGAVSNKEMELFAQVAPQLSNTVEGNLLIIKMAKQLSKKKIEVAKLARKYMKQRGTFDEGFYDQLDKFYEENPLFSQDIYAEVEQLTGAAEEAQDRGLTSPPSAEMSNVSDDELKRIIGIP